MQAELHSLVDDAARSVSAFQGPECRTYRYCCTGVKQSGTLESPAVQESSKADSEDLHLQGWHMPVDRASSSRDRCCMSGHNQYDSMLWSSSSSLKRFSNRKGSPSVRCSAHGPSHSCRRLCKIACNYVFVTVSLFSATILTLHAAILILLCHV